MANCTGPCVGSDTDLLELILQRAVDNVIRLSQVIQSFETSTGQPQSNQGTLTAASTFSCSDTRLELLSDILIQRQNFFDRLQQFLEAI